MVGVDYSSDVRLVEKILYKVADQHPDVVADQENTSYVRFNDFGDSALIFELFFWSHNAFRIEVTKSDIRFMILEEFTKNGIKIPFPQRDVHLINPTK